MRIPGLAGGETGIAIIALLFLLFLTGIAFYLGNVSSTGVQLQRQKVTMRALAQAKEALIAYAVSQQLFISGPNWNNRPGDLPCPDLLNNGQPPAGNCDTQSQRLGRLPWRTLGLADLRDGDGERLWYAVSTNFKKSTRIAPLNSDSRGTITVRDSAGTMVNDGTNPNPYVPSGAIAVIFSPGAALQRQGAATSQDRGCGSDTTCQTTGVCASVATPRCNPVNYLDVGLGEDNADFVDNNSNGFIQGKIKDAAGNTILNDALAVITYQEIMPRMEQRVVGEVRNCLNDYAAANGNRYPWAADINSPAIPSTSTITDKSGNRFGRLADLFYCTNRDSGGTDTCSAAIGNGGGGMKDHWVGSCTIGGGWWTTNNWRETLFYGVAAAYSPTSVSTSCGSCLTVNTLSPQTNKRFVVIAAGGRLNVSGGQARGSGNTSNIANYLEGQNTPLDMFQAGPVTPIFNDTVGYP